MAEGLPVEDAGLCFVGDGQRPLAGEAVGEQSWEAAVGVVMEPVSVPVDAAEEGHSSGLPGSGKQHPVGMSCWV